MEYCAGSRDFLKDMESSNPTKATSSAARSVAELLCPMCQKSLMSDEEEGCTSIAHHKKFILDELSQMRALRDRVSALEEEVAKLKSAVARPDEITGRQMRRSITSEATAAGQDGARAMMRLAVGMDTGKVAVLDLTTFKFVVLSAEQHRDAVGCVTSLDDGRFISASDDGAIVIWNKEGSVQAAVGSGAARLGPSAILCATHTADGRLVTAGEDKSVRVWSLESLELLLSMEGHTAAINACVTLPNNRLASCSSDWTIRIWALANGACEQEMKGHLGAVHACTLLPCMERLVTASEDGTMRVWNLSTGICERIIAAHTKAVLTVTVKDPYTLASGGQDGVVKLWRLSDWQCSDTLEGHADAVSQVVPLPNGAFASSSIDGEVHIWSPCASEKIRVMCPATPLALALLRPTRV